MKKTAISILSVILMFSMAACSKPETPSDLSDKPSLTSETAFEESKNSASEEVGSVEDFIFAQYEVGDIVLALNYPAFHFVNTYAETYHLSGDYMSGWYMPSITELCDIYQNREAVNNSLQHIYNLDSQAAMNGLETNWYWSSSQADSEDDYAWFVHYFNGYAGECPKNFTNVHALAVRAFGGTESEPQISDSGNSEE